MPGTAGTGSSPGSTQHPMWGSTERGWFPGWRQAPKAASKPGSGRRSQEWLRPGPQQPGPGSKGEACQDQQQRPDRSEPLKDPASDLHPRPCTRTEARRALGASCLDLHRVTQGASPAPRSTLLKPHKLDPQPAASVFIFTTVSFTEFSVENSR